MPDPYDVAAEPPSSAVETTAPTISTPVTDARGVAVPQGPPSTTSAATTSAATTSASTTDTWGIPSTTFLAYYGGAIVLAIVLAKITKATLTPRPDKSVTSVAQLDVYEVAALNAGPKLVGVTVVARLQRVPMAVPVGADGQAMGQGYVDERHLTRPVEQAALKLWRSQPGLALDQLRSQVEKLPETEALIASLQKRGLLRTPGGRAALRLRALWPLAVVGLGVARILAGTANTKPVLYISLLTGFAGLVTLGCLGAPTRTRRGQKLLTDAQKQPGIRDLSQSAFASGMPIESASLIGLAVFGSTVLWAADPTMAGMLGAPRTLGGLSGDTGSSSSGGSDGGSSDGGSSCGGGCGGGGCGG